MDNSMSAGSENNRIQEQVNAICNELYAKGTKPTVRLVLSMLPDVSSTSTVHKYFANWRREIEANQQSLYDKLGFSKEFAQSFMKEITRFSVEAEQRYKQMAMDANEQRDSALDDLARSEDRLFKQNAVIDQLEKENEQLKQALAATKAEAKAELQKTIELSNAALEKERGTHSAVVSELRQQLKQDSEKVASLSESNEQLRTEIAKARLKLEGNQQYVDEVKAQSVSLIAENKELAREIAELNRRLAGQEATLNGNTRLIENLEATIKENSSKLNQYEQERIETNLRQKTLETELSQLQKALQNEIENNNSAKKTIDEQSRVIEKFTGSV